MDFFNNLKNPAHTPFDGLWFIGERRKVKGERRKAAFPRPLNNFLASNL